MKDIKFQTKEELDDFMYALGFCRIRDNFYWHKEMGSDVLIDLSAVHMEAWAVMSKILPIVIQFGKDEKLKEIQTVLNIKN